MKILQKLRLPAWRARLLYGLFAVVAFVLSLRWTFPGEAVKERLIMEAGARGWQIDLERAEPGGVLGMKAVNVSLADGSGLRIPIDELTASLRILPLLAGRRSVAFDAHLYDGRIVGTADLSGDVRDIEVRIDGVDLARALPLRKASGMDLLGTVSGTADLAVPAAPNEKPTGRIDLAVAEAGIAGGQLPVPGMTSGFPLPKVALGQVTAAVKLDQGRATFEKLEATGGDAELSTDGLYVVLQPRIEAAPLFGKAKLRVHDAFWANGNVQGFRGIAEAALASAKGRDGAWNFQLAGSVGHPQMRPAPGG